MSPDSTERWPRQETSVQEDGSEHVRIRLTGCPCGCMTKPPWLDDPDCVRHRPIGEPRDWGRYDVTTLGLAPHDRERCGPCMAVGR